MLPLALPLVFLLYCIPLHVSFCWGSAGVCSTRHILSLPGATERLTLFKADINAQGSFDSAVHGCDFVVHMATPTDYTKDPETGVIQAAVNGSLDILSACTYTSSITAASPLKDKGEYMDFVDESCWTNVDLIRREKPPFWISLNLDGSASSSHLSQWVFQRRYHRHRTSDLWKLLDVVLLPPTTPVESASPFPTPEAISVNPVLEKYLPPSTSSFDGWRVASRVESYF